MKVEQSIILIMLKPLLCVHRGGRRLPIQHLISNLCSAHWKTPVQKNWAIRNAYNAESLTLYSQWGPSWRNRNLIQNLTLNSNSTLHKTPVYEISIIFIANLSFGLLTACFIPLCDVISSIHDSCNFPAGCTPLAIYISPWTAQACTKWVLKCRPKIW